MRVDARHLGKAIRWVQATRAQDQARPLEALIEQACKDHGLSLDEATWLRWSLDPASVALQSKEPSR
jgi:hypothetical protein